MRPVPGRTGPYETAFPDAGPEFNDDRATDAYINLLSEEDRARSDTYMEVGYCLTGHFQDHWPQFDRYEDGELLRFLQANL